ncbi:MAG: carbamoyl-phosphate synthase small subunit [Chthoniobacter sp.]|jgi:carbamoyl-phosphate synthase small subunit|nr:carbamoyl-phosphate synthase small subunit [Chthoniobacter sp.]
MMFTADFAFENKNAAAKVRRMRATLALEDGRIFEGESFGATGTALGEVVFNTSMTGYQEVLSDPSYRGQIVAMTYPLIGNYGVNALDDESGGPHVRGFVIEELSAIASNWRSQMSLHDYLQKWNIPGIQGIDTRALTRHLREKGAMKACLTTEESLPANAVSLAQQGEGMVGMDYVEEVTARAAYDWDPGDTQSRMWTIVKGDGSNTEIGENGEAFEKLPPIGHEIVAYDFGIKHNILRNLRQQGFRVRVVPAQTSAADVLALKPDGVFLSNGPGDPAALGYAHETLRELVGKTPVFGICLGHQLLGYAFGGKTFKLKFGHHGGNQPVQDVQTGRVAITAQNHGFAVDADSLPSNVEVSHINLNDGTVEGLRHREHPVFSVQYHPEAAPGPHDAHYFFGEFRKLIEETKSR